MSSILNKMQQRCEQRPKPLRPLRSPIVVQQFIEKWNFQIFSFFTNTFLKRNATQMWSISSTLLFWTQLQIQSQWTLTPSSSFSFKSYVVLKCHLISHNMNWVWSWMSCHHWCVCLIFIQSTSAPFPQSPLIFPHARPICFLNRLKFRHGSVQPPVILGQCHEGPQHWLGCGRGTSGRLGMKTTTTMFVCASVSVLTKFASTSCLMLSAVGRHAI